MTPDLNQMKTMSKRQIYAKALNFRNKGYLYDKEDMALNDVFNGSIDRFSEIAYQLRNSPKVLDIGSGHGIFLSLLSSLGHDCYGIDFFSDNVQPPAIYKEHNIAFRNCNIEIEPLPFPDATFDAVTCCQVLEHFSHSHLPAVKEMMRVLKPGGILEIDVPNAVCFRNRSRILRGKHITFEYAEHYLHARPILYKGYSFYPLRHNREFTRKELLFLLRTAGFDPVDVRFLKSRRYRTGFTALLDLASRIKNLIPSWRKSLIAFSIKPNQSQ